MFTGLVEEIGQTISVQVGRRAAQLRIRAVKVLEGTVVGNSIAVAGCCLTVTDLSDPASFVVDVIAETLARTTLGGLVAGDPVNLERAMPAGGRWGGHVVSGHVDGTGVVVDRSQRVGEQRLRVQIPRRLAPLVAERGSVCLDGVSLTVTAVGGDWLEVGLIPTTLAATTLGGLEPRRYVNVEVDLLARYLQRLVATSQAVR